MRWEERIPGLDKGRIYIDLVSKICYFERGNVVVNRKLVGRCVII